MNARIIELLQQPSLMQANDLQLLEKQIEHTPYVQNVRALYLYGIHLYNPTRYKEVLTTTAAYTTDKKILYQFINKKNIEEVTSVEAEPKIDAIVPPVTEKENLVSDKTSEAVVEKTIENKEESSEVEAQQEEDVMNVEEGSKDLVVTEETPVAEKVEEIESDLSLESVDENLIENKEESPKVEAQQEEDVMNAEEGSKDIVVTEETPVAEKVEDIESDLSLESIDENLSVSKEESSEVEAQQEEDVMNAEEGSKDVVVTEETPVAEKIEDIASDLSLESIDENLSVNKEESSEVEAQQEEDVMNAEEGSKDVVVTDADPLIEVKEELNKDVSFESIDDFLPQVKFEVPKNHHQFLNPPKFEVKEHKAIEIEDKPTGIIDDVPHEDLQVLEDNQSLDFGPFATDEDSIGKQESIVETTEPIQKHEEVKTDEVKSVNFETDSGWKPMSLDTHQPDALIGKAIVETQVKPEVSKDVTIEKIENVVTESIVEEKLDETTVEPILEQKEEEKRPIFNVSFFSDSLAIVKDEEKPSEAKEELVIEVGHVVENNEPTITEPKENKTSKSNVGQFINTWQSWLKIDRSAEIEKDKEVKKQKAIDEFIENQPKISQLKEEGSFVVKEKKEDISHLMTETFANLYLEQKLYSKAIKAFESLKIKHPEKAEYFESKIEEVKEQRKA